MVKDRKAVVFLFFASDLSNEDSWLFYMNERQEKLMRDGICSQELDVGMG